MSVLLGNGDGTFQAAVTYGSGGVRAFSVAVGDFNGDGRPDLLVANSYSAIGGNYIGSVGVLLNIASPLNTTTTTIASSSNPSSFGQSVTFTATVTPQGSGTPTGTVTFTYWRTTLVQRGGPAGRRSGYLSYFGFASWGWSPSPPPIAEIPTSTPVRRHSTRWSIRQVRRDAEFQCQPIGIWSASTFTATIMPQYGGQASGTITFKDGATTLGSGAVSGNAASLTTSGLAIGTRSIAAIYSGDANHAGSTSAVLTQAVKAATTTTTLASSTNPSMLGSSIMFTATVTTSASTTTTGTVTFMDGAATLGTGTLSGGVATYTTSSLAVGQHSMTAVYSGDTSKAGSTSSVLTQTVNAANFTLTSNPASTTVTAGHSGTFTVTVTPQGSFTSPISFTCTGLPTLAAWGSVPRRSLRTTTP